MMVTFWITTSSSSRNPTKLFRLSGEREVKCLLKKIVFKNVNMVFSTYLDTCSEILECICLVSVFGSIILPHWDLRYLPWFDNLSWKPSASWDAFPYWSKILSEWDCQGSRDIMGPGKPSVRWNLGIELRNLKRTPYGFWECFVQERGLSDQSPPCSLASSSTPEGNLGLN